jgi:hypothetical protein
MYKRIPEEHGITLKNILKVELTLSMELNASKDPMNIKPLLLEIL